MATAHRSKFTGRQMKERQVDGTAPAVARPSGDIPLLEQLRSVDIRIVAQLLPAIFRLL